jgi:hypothetical protein
LRVPDARASERVQLFDQRIDVVPAGVCSRCFASSACSLVTHASRADYARLLDLPGHVELLRARHPANDTGIGLDAERLRVRRWPSTVSATV